jgi:hypothetical protein
MISKGKNIGIFPDRRHYPNQKSDKSITEWVRQVFGNTANSSNTYFHQVEV